MLYRLAWLVFYLITRAVLAVYGGLRVTGRENVPRSGGVIVAPNHISFADPPIVEAVICRGSWFMATDELFAMKVLGPLARLMRGFPVRQDSPDRSALRKADDLLKRGESVVIFPEGHVSKSGKLQPIQPGTIMAALRAGVPILPVGIINTDKMMPPHTFNLRRSPSPIELRIGVPISPEALAGGMRGRAAVDHGAALLRRVLLELIGQDESDVPVEEGRATAPQYARERVGGTPHLRGASLAEYSRGQYRTYPLEERISWPTLLPKPVSASKIRRV